MPSPRQPNFRIKPRVDVPVNLIYVVITQQYEQIMIFKGAVTVSVISL